MNQIKSILYALMSLTVAIVAFGFFASIGLAVVGILVTLGVVAAIAISVHSFLATKENASVSIA